MKRKRNASLHYIPHLPETHQTASFKCEHLNFFSEVTLKLTILAKTAFSNSAEVCCFIV